MDTRKEMLVRLLYNLWSDKDFEENFKLEWKAVYNMLLAGDFEKVPDNILELIDFWSEDF